MLMYYSDLIVKPKQKVSFVSRLTIDAAWKTEGFFANIISRKRRAKQPKKIQGDVFLFNWKRHAKFQALLQKKKNTSDRLLAWFCTQPFN